MKLQENLKIKGHVAITVYDRDGNIKDARSIPNLVVTAGKQYIASRMVGTAASVMSHMGIGTSSAAPAAGDTDLTTPTGTRVALDTFDATTNTVTGTATFPSANGTGAITEAGIFNASTSGTMLCRTTFPVVNKGAGDSIAITWTITVS
jgi:hypothetical protein